MMLPARLRAFVAIRMTPDVDRAIADFVDEVRAPGDGIGWIRRGNLHLTLRFLGDQVDSAVIPSLDLALREAASATPQFIVEARGVGAFPDVKRPRIIWIGLHSMRLMELARRVEDSAVRCGFEAEARPFSPHMTIGRVRGFRGGRMIRGLIQENAERAFGESPVDSMTLYRSTMSAAGSIYESLGDFHFEA